MTPMIDDKSIDRKRQKSSTPNVTPKKMILKTPPIKTLPEKPITSDRGKKNSFPSPHVNAEDRLNPMLHTDQQYNETLRTDAINEKRVIAMPDTELPGIENDETTSLDTLHAEASDSAGIVPPKTEKLKSSNVCVLLSLIPIAGIPRMYLGYWKIGIIQFLLSVAIPVLLPVILALLLAVIDKVFGSDIISNLNSLSPLVTLMVGMPYVGWFYCYIEAHFLKKDKKGRDLKPGSFWQRVGYILFGIVCLTILIVVPLMGWAVVEGIRHSKELNEFTSPASLVMPLCMMGIIMLSCIGSIIGLIGVVRAAKGRFYLHNATKDILLSIPLVVLHWMSIAATLYVSVELSEKGYETASNIAMIMGCVLWLISLWFIGCRVKRCNEDLTKWELVQATCARIFLIFLIQFMSLLALSAIISLKNKQKQVGSSAKLRLGDFLDEGKSLLRTWGAIGKKVLPLIIISTFCITLTKKVCQLIGNTSSKKAEVDTLGYGVLNLLAVAASIGGMVALVNYVEELPAAPVKPQVQHVEPAHVQPAAEQGFDFAPEPEADANQTPEHPGTMADPAPTAEVSTVTESAPTPKKVATPILNNSVESEQRATADTGAAQRDTQAYEPTGDTPMEQAIAAMAYSFSPEHSIKAELIPLKDGTFFKREAQNGEQVTVSAWVKLKFIDKDPRFLSFMESIKNLFAQGATLEKTFPRAVRPVADDTSDETMCRDAGDLAPAQYPAVTYIATDTMLEDISADTNLLLLSVDETIYGFSLNDEKSRSYVLYDMLKHICGIHGIFPLRIMVQMKDKDKQVLAEIAREDTEDENHGQPMYSLIYSNVAEKEALVIDPSFYGGRAVVYAEPGCLYFQERIVKVTGVISTKAAKEAAYVGATIEAPSFKLSKKDICEFAERMEQAEKYDNEKKTANSAAALPAHQPATAISAPVSMAGKRIRFIYTDTRFRSGEEGDDGECVWENWQTQDLSQADLWVGQVAPSELNFASSDKAIVKPVVNDGSYLLIGTYTSGSGNNATVHRQLAIRPEEVAEESGDYILVFDSPSGGTAALRNCVGGLMHFECENIKFVIEEMSEAEIEAANAATQGGISETEKAELEDFLDTLVMTPARSSSTWRLYQGRLLMLLPMIQEGAPVDVTTSETKGNTALHYACGMGRIDIVEWLVNHGADVNKKTDKGATPLDCVSGGYNAAEIRRFLIQHGATKGKKGRR